MGKLRESQPVLASLGGVWDGEYVYVDAKHNVIDRHKSRLICRILDDDSETAHDYAQTNIYTWPDGSREIRYFTAKFESDRLILDNDLIKGWSADIPFDFTHRTHMVGWVRKDTDDIQFYEIVTINPDGTQQNRTWHWYRDGTLFMRTLIDEVRISKEWRTYDKPAYRTSKARAKA